MVPIHMGDERGMRTENGERGKVTRWGVERKKQTEERNWKEREAAKKKTDGTIESEDQWWEGERGSRSTCS